MNKQTAVQWLIDHIKNPDGFPYNTPEELFEMALQMEKQQIFECWQTAHQAGRFEGKGIAIENWQTFKKYYNEEYGGNNEQ